MKIKSASRALIIWFSIGVLLCVFTLGGAIGTRKTAAAEETNFVESSLRSEEFLLSGWRLYYDYDFKSFEEQTQDLVDAGMNWIMWAYPWEDKNGNTNPVPDTLEEWSEIDRLYGEMGLKYMIKRGTSASTDRVEKYLEILPYLENCEFLYLADEPSGSALAGCASYLQTLVEAYPEICPYVNLYPSYAGRGILGGSYYDYVRSWVTKAGSENLEYLSFDFYPFRDGDNLYEPSFFSDLEVIRMVAYENGKIKTSGFVQTGSWMGTRRPDAKEIRWQMNAMLAYGFKALNHFCWVSPYPGNESMNDDFPISRVGNKSEYYEDIVDTNWVVRSMGNVLMNYDCSAAYHTDTSVSIGDAMPKSFAFLSEEGGDLIFSNFVSKDGADNQIMIFNKSLTTAYTDKITINALSNVGKVEQFCKAEGRNTDYDYQNVDIENGYFDVDIQPGEAVLFKLTAKQAQPAEDEPVTEQPTPDSEEPSAKSGCGAAVTVRVGGIALLLTAATLILLKKEIGC